MVCLSVAVVVETLTIMVLVAPFAWRVLRHEDRLAALDKGQDELDQVVEGMIEANRRRPPV